MQKRRITWLFLIILCFAALLWAATATVSPDADNSAGSWTTTPLFQSVDEDIDTPDSVVIASSNNPSTPTNDVVFEITCPSDTDTVTDANLRIRSREQGNSGRSISLAVTWSATTATNFSTGNMPSTFSNYSSGNKTGLSIGKAACDGSTIKVAPTTTGSGAAERAEIDGINLDIIYTVGSGPNVKRLLISQTILLHSTP